MWPAFQTRHGPVCTRRQGFRVAAERTATPASSNKILTAISRRERKRIRVIRSGKSAKCALKASDIYNAIESIARQRLSG